MLPYRDETVNRYSRGRYHRCPGRSPLCTPAPFSPHARLVTAGLKELLDQVDVVVLAQASMARVVDTLPEAEKRVPILSSPRLGVEAAKQTLAALP